jgi:hypothetical protein
MATGGITHQYRADELAFGFLMILSGGRKQSSKPTRIAS